jgi:hypothetical protein
LFRQHAPGAGLTEDLLDSTLMHNGTEYRIIGWAARAPKMPIVLRETSGNGKMRCSVQWLCKKLNMPSPPQPKPDWAAKAAEGMERRGESLGLSKDLVGRTFLVGSRRVKFLGIKPNSRKMPVADAEKPPVQAM